MSFNRRALGLTMLMLRSGLCASSGVMGGGYPCAFMSASYGAVQKTGRLLHMHKHNHMARQIREVICTRPVRGLGIRFLAAAAAGKKNVKALSIDRMLQQQVLRWCWCPRREHIRRVSVAVTIYYLHSYNISLPLTQIANRDLGRVSSAKRSCKRVT